MGKASVGDLISPLSSMLNTIILYSRHIPNNTPILLIYQINKCTGLCIFFSPNESSELKYDLSNRGRQ